MVNVKQYDSKVCVHSPPPWLRSGANGASQHHSGAARHLRFGNTLPDCRHSSTPTGICFGTDSPTRLFLLGSDDYGRDLFSRFLYGGQISLFAGLLGAGLSLGVGMRARRAGRLLRGVGGRDHHAGGGAVPRAAVVVSAVRGSDGLTAAHRAGAGVSAGPRGDRAHRVGAPGAIDSRCRAQRQDCATTSSAARGLGASDLYLLRRHVLPQVLGIALTQAALLAAAIHPGRGHVVVLRSRRGRTGAELGKHAGQSPALRCAVVLLVDVRAWSGVDSRVSAVLRAGRRAASASGRLLAVNVVEQFGTHSHWSV